MTVLRSVIVPVLVWTTFTAAAQLFAANAQAQDASTNVRVTLVSRGDILRVQHGAEKYAVMLYGVTCPGTETPVGEQARRFTENLVGGQDVTMTVRYRQPQVQYVEIKLSDGRVLNRALLAAGLGKLDTVVAAEDEEYARLQEQAKSRNLGVWQPADATPAADSGPENESPLDRFKRLQRLSDEVAYAVELDHWRALSEPQRTHIRQTLAARAASRSQDYAQLESELSDELNAVEREQASLQNELDQARRALDESGPEEEAAVDELYAGDQELVRLETNWSDERAATAIALRDYGGNSDTYYRQLEEEEFAEKLAAERRATLARREVQIRAEFDSRRAEYRERIADLEDELTDKNREVTAVAKDLDRAITQTDSGTARADSALVGVDDLDAAVAEDYRPNLKRVEAGIWRGRGSSETPAFDIKQDVWVLDYDSGSAAGKREFKAIVRRESDRGLVQQIVDNTLPHQSFSVLKGAGSYYVEILAPDTLSWTVTVSGYSNP